MWITSNDLQELGVTPATMYRKGRSGEWKTRQGKSTGAKGQPPKEFLLASLPADLQLKWMRLQEERRASAVEAESVEGLEACPPPDARLSKLQAALARFSPPLYSLEQRQAVERRCAEMAALCDQAAALAARLKRQHQLTVRQAGSHQAGPDRAYHPDLVELANRTASADPTYNDLYPSSVTALSVRSLLRLVKSYQQEGPVAFIHGAQTLSPQVDERFHDVPQAAIDWLQTNLKNYVKASVTLFGKKWLAWAHASKIALPFSEHRPGKPGTCYAWLYRWRQRVPAVSVTLAKEGLRGVEAKYGYIVRDYSELTPRLGFTMDWRIFDVECWLPAKKAGGKPALTRLWVCPVFDLASRAVFGFAIADRPSARGVTLAYLNAIGDAEWKAEPGLELLRGMQRAANEIAPFVHWDNGKDYRAYAVEGREIVIEHFDLESGLVNVLQTYKVGLAAEVGIQVRHAKPFNAKSKIIEPFFRYALGLWEEGLPGFKGNKPENKPHFYPAARRIHEAFIKGRSPKPEDLRQLPPLWRETYERNLKEYGFGTPFLSEAEFKKEWIQFLLNYLKTPHGALTNDRGEMSPLEYLSLNASTPHKLTEQTMAALLMEARILTVSRGQLSVQWGGEKFLYREVASDLSDGTALYRLPEKAQVEFRYDPAGLGRALVIGGGAPLCWVEQPELLSWKASQADFDQANARKKLARRTANEFFETRTQPADWRDEAAERQDNVTPMRAVVNGPDVTEEFEIADLKSQSAEVIVPTRFDRKQGGRGAGGQGRIASLRVVHDADPGPDQLDDGLKTFAEDGKEETLKELWEE